MTSVLLTKREVCVCVCVWFLILINFSSEWDIWAYVCISLTVEKNNKTKPILD